MFTLFSVCIPDFDCDIIAPDSSPRNPITLDDKDFIPTKTNDIHINPFAIITPFPVPEPTII